MRLKLGTTCVDFAAGERLAGRYRYGDPWKPHLHPLNTPAGETVSLASPHDHKHHKGLMYALKAADLNFWEETVGPDGVPPGRQRHERFIATTKRGESVGFEEELTWLDPTGATVTLRERRTLACRRLPDDGGFAWSWSTEMEALRDVRLVPSIWSHRTEDGRLVNYHGLGLRLRRDFGCTGGNELRLDGVATPFPDGMGRTPAEVEFRGSIDGTCPPRRAGVQLRQSQRNGLFVMETPFAFMSLGPSNLGPRELAAGQRLVERYAVVVRDLPEQRDPSTTGEGSRH